MIRSAISKHAVLLCCVVALNSGLSAPKASAQHDDLGGEPINYLSQAVNDPVAKLSKKLDAGETSLSFDKEHGGYLLSALEQLDIPISSQMLVFSKTSLQQSRISPRRPRAVYFNEDVYVGYCQNGEVLELAATDPKQGAIFYTLEQSTGEKPKFVRDRGQCLACHHSSRTQDVPGYLVRSVFPNSMGYPEYGNGTFNSDHTSPFQERWGGWYVTGTHGQMRHMGNVLLDRGAEDIDRDKHANITSLDGLVSTSAYACGHSDIVALMVLEHQTQMHNAIAWANYETRRAIHQSGIMNKALDRPEGYLSESSNRRIDGAADRVLEYLLMCDEFPLGSPIKGTSGFQENFEARGITDCAGRSLREFDLKTRMFKYPCSYMIYSEAFDGLPDEARTRILTRLNEILLGRLDEKQSQRFAKIDVKGREVIRQILVETKPEFAELVGDR